MKNMYRAFGTDFNKSQTQAQQPHFFMQKKNTLQPESLDEKFNKPRIKFN